VKAIVGKGKLRISTAGKNKNVVEITEVMGLGIWVLQKNTCRVFMTHFSPPTEQVM
jgi:hypothetical protein